MLHGLTALSPRKERLESIRQEAVWVPVPVWTLWNREEPLAPEANLPPAVQPVAHRYAD
jgi:hypothetical protein